MSSATMKVQAQIRANATEISSYLEDMQKWEKNIKQTDKKITAKKGIRGKSLPIRAGVGTVSTVSTPGSVSPAASKPPVASEGVTETDRKEGEEEGKGGSAAKHTYDVGYKKWENIDVDALLEEQDSAEEQEAAEKEKEQRGEDQEQEEALLTPASMADRAAKNIKHVTAPVPKARGLFNNVDAETAERERGNGEFKKGNFSAAAKSYTRCLGLKSRNYVAFSNRAMAYLKMKEFVKAEADSSCALLINPTHVKSLVRRATARSQQGKLRAALADLLSAQAAEDAPSKSIAVDLAKTRELLKNAVSRAPLHPLSSDSVVWATEELSADGDGGMTMLEGPEVPAFSAAPEGATRVAIVDDDDGEEEEDEEEDVPDSQDMPVTGTKVAIEFDDDDEEQQQQPPARSPAPAPAPTKKTVVEEVDDKVRTSAVTPETTPTKSAVSSPSPKTSSGKKKSKKAAGSGSVKSAYELERLLLTCRGNAKAATELFTVRMRPKHLEKLLPSMLEADVLHSLFVALDKFSTDQPAGARAVVLADWAAVLTSSQSAKSAVGLLVRLLTVSQRAELTAIAQARSEALPADLSAEEVTRCTATLADMQSLLK